MDRHVQGIGHFHLLLYVRPNINIVFLSSLDHFAKLACRIRELEHGDSLAKPHTKLCEHWRNTYQVSNPSRIGI